MPAIVSDVIKGSIAEELEIAKGDIVLSIDEMPMADMIDYNFLCKDEIITLEIKKANGEIEEIELEKDYDEDLGIIFESAVFDKVKQRLNESFKIHFCDSPLERTIPNLSYIFVTQDTLRQQKSVNLCDALIVL